MIKDKILTYSFENLADISVDIQKRNYYYKKVSHILQKKCELDINYSNSIDNLIVKQNHRAIHEEIPSQFLYATIIELIQEETKRIRLFAESLKYQIIKMISQYDKESSQIKKSMMLSHSINKDIISQKEKLQKSKHKFQKKNKELQQSKVEYLVSFLNSEQLQKKNSFYLTVNGLEEAIKPLKDDYEDLTNKFNEQIEVNMEQINSILTKIELVEYKKINSMKNVVNTYLKNQKKLIDQTLRCNPFRIANVDSVREVNEFKVHTEEDLLNQKERLLIPYSNEAAFINRIYDRMQIKKNLPQIILYGQTRQYRSEITRIFNKQAILQIPKLNPKTIRIIDIFRQIFQGQIHENIFEQLKSLLIKQEMIRKDFTICLQKYRINNQFQLQFRNKDNILKSLNIFLDICHQELDTYNSKMLMILAFTYHFQHDQQKIELQELIKYHQIWKRLGWWQAALLQSIFQETRVKIKKEELTINIWDIKAGGINRKQEGQELTHQHICFNQLIYYVRNMNLFQLEPKIIYQYARQNINLLKFSGKFAKDILEICPKINIQENSIC